MATALSDLLFWVIATPVTYAYLLMGNWAELRFYVFLGIFLGLFLYFTVFSVIVLNLLLTIWYYGEMLTVDLVQGCGASLLSPWEGVDLVAPPPPGGGLGEDHLPGDLPGGLFAAEVADLRRLLLRLSFAENRTKSTDCQLHVPQDFPVGCRSLLTI